MERQFISAFFLLYVMSMTFFASSTLLPFPDWVASKNHDSSEFVERRRKVTSERGISPRIIGGNQAKKRRYPYTVALIRYPSRYVCAGSLVAPDVVMSAAHCFDSFDQVYVGQTVLSGYSEDKYEAFAVVETVVHPFYDPEKLPYDYMLVKIDGNSTKRPVILNKDETIPSEEGEDLTVVGWGVTEVNGKVVSDVLNEAVVRYIPNRVCDSSKHLENNEYNYQGLITDDMMCASAPGKDACSGDSGGPLIIKNRKTSLDIQVGLVSWGYQCAYPSLPGVYARVSSEIKWISQTICNISDSPPSDFMCGGSAYDLTPSPSPTTLPGSQKPTFVSQSRGSSSGHSPGNVIHSNVTLEESIAIFIEIVFDDCPPDVGWIIQSIDTETGTGSFCKRTPPGSYSSDLFHQVITEEVFLPEPTTGENQEFKFIVTDDAENSTCSGWGVEYYNVYMNAVSPENLLIAGAGAFGPEAVHDFILSYDLGFPSESKEAITSTQDASSEELDSSAASTTFFLGFLFKTFVAIAWFLFR